MAKPFIETNRMVRTFESGAITIVQSVDPNMTVDEARTLWKQQADALREYADAMDRIHKEIYS